MSVQKKSGNLLKAPYIYIYIYIYIERERGREREYVVLLLIFYLKRENFFSLSNLLTMVIFTQ